MKIRLIILFILLFTVSLSFSQQNNKTKKYKRMEGTIGKNIDITANFVELFGTIKGNYQYKFESKTIDSIYNYYGKMIELNGELYNKDSVRFQESGSEDYTIKGVWGVDFFNGKWKIPGEDNYMDMLLKEYYPEGSLSFKVYYLQSEQKLVKSRKDSPEASIELVLVYPSGNFGSLTAEAEIKKTVNRSYFGEGIKQGTPQLMMKLFEQEYYKMYFDNKDDWLEIGGMSFNWELKKSMNVIFNSDNLLCVEYDRYAFTGGAHGMQNISYDVFNLKTGDKLNYKDIFIEGSDSLLTALLTKEMINQYKTKKKSSLKELGFFVDTISPNNNIFVSGNGIGFKYSSYEIAAYAVGLPEVFLTFDKLKGILKKDTPVYKLAHK